MRNYPVSLCLVILLMIALPAIAAADSSQLTTAPTDAITPGSTPAPAPAQGFDLFGIIAGILGFHPGTQAARPSDTGMSNPVTSPGGNSGTGPGVNPDAEALVAKAWSLNAQEKFPDASAALDQAVSLDPATPGISFNRGWALAGMGKYQDALVALDKATDESPDSEIAWANKGYVLSHLGRCDEAVSAYQQAQSLDPSDPAVKYDLDSISDHCIASATTAPQTVVVTTTQPVAIISEPPTTLPATPATLPAANVPQLVAENMNTGGVNNGATSGPRFTFATPVVIVSLYDYHWNDGKGDTPGTITIQDVSTNQIYGPFATHGLPGQGGVPNALWETEPGITLTAGTFSVKDSNPATWSQNGQTGGAGMTHIVYQQAGSTAYSPPPVSTAPTASPVTTTRQPAVTQTPGSSPSFDPGSVWTVKESGDMGNYDGTWTREKGKDIFDASWSGGAITDTVTITSVTGNTIILHRQGNNGDYTGTISPDGRTITGKGSWYDAGETWTVTIV